MHSGDQTPMNHLAAAVFLAAGAAVASAQFPPANPEWNRPIEPFRIAGNIYYVGVSGVSSYLIATPEGHILVDAAFRESAPTIEANIQKLGFRVTDIRLILVSHGHYDHVGGVAEIKARSKALLLASPADAPLLSRGGTGDFAFGDDYPYPRVAPDRLLSDGEQIRLGETALTARFTPGHTRGCVSWTTEVNQGGRLLRVVIPCSVSAPGYQLVNNTNYPEILKDYEAAFATLRALPCDIFLALHGWDFGLEEKMQARAADPASNPFIDPEGYRRYLERGQANIRDLAAKQGRK